MSANEGVKLTTECERKALEVFLKSLGSTIREIKEFNKIFNEFIEEERKRAHDLWSRVTRYNILNAGPPCTYPLIEKEEMLQEMIVQIQDKTALIKQSLYTIKEKYDKLPKLNRVLEKQSLELDWNPVTNAAVKGTSKHKSLSKYMEEIADILFQYDVSITTMLHYFNALRVKDSDSYQNFMNSISISTEITDNVKEFLINCSMLLS